MSEKDAYAQAWLELEDGKIDKGAWAQAFAEDERTAGLEQTVGVRSLCLLCDLRETSA